MAGFSERIQYLIEVSTSGASRELDQFRTKLNQAEGAGGKVRAAMGGIGDTIRNNLGLSIAGASSVVVGFAFKAIDTWRDAARNAGYLADAVGLNAKQADGLLQVFRPLGVEVNDLTEAITNVNKAAGEGKLAEIGITADDTLDRFDQVLGYLAGIEDETIRAIEAQELLGEENARRFGPILQNWEKYNQLIDESVAKSAIDDSDVQKARDYDRAMADLNLIMRDLAVNVAPILADVLSSIAGVLKDIDDLGVPKALDWLGKLPSLPETITGLYDLALDPWRNDVRTTARRVDLTADQLEARARIGLGTAPTVVNNTTVYMPEAVTPTSVQDAINRRLRREGSIPGSVR